MLWRKRIACHVEGCDTCERTRERVAPLALFGSAPAFALPVGLRDVVLQRAGTPSSGDGHGYRFEGKDGFPGAAKTTSRLVAEVVATVAAIALVFAAVLFPGSDDDDSDSDSDSARRGREDVRRIDHHDRGRRHRRELHHVRAWSLGGAAGSEPITFTRSGSRWRGTIVKPTGFGQPNGGDYDVLVSATDSRDNHGSDTDGFYVEICPQ